MKLRTTPGKIDELKLLLEPIRWPLSDSLSRVRNPLVSTFGLVKASYVLETLLGLTQDKDSRYVAIEALGDLGDTRAKGALVDLLHSSDNNTRYFPAVALGRIGAQISLSELERPKNDSSVAWGGTVGKAIRLAIKMIETRNK